MKEEIEPGNQCNVLKNLGGETLGKPHKTIFTLNYPCLPAEYLLLFTDT